MRFSLASVLALAGAVLAVDPTTGFNVISKPAEGEQVPAGSTYQIVWAPTAQYPGPITIGLLGGATPQLLDIVDTIATSVDPSTGSYSWEVPATLGNLATYGIKITLDSDKDVYQFGFPFKIVGGSSTGSSSTGSATATASETETAASSSVTNTGSSSSASRTASTSVAPPSSTIVSSTIRSNLSTTATGNPQTTITSLVTQQPTTTKTATSSIVTNGVASLAAGSFAMLGGVAMAVLAL